MSDIDLAGIEAALLSGEPIDSGTVAVLVAEVRRLRDEVEHEALGWVSYDALFMRTSKVEWELTKATNAIARVRELHYESDGRRWQFDRCHHDGDIYPCATLRALDGE